MANVSDIKVGMEIAEKVMGPDYQLGGAEHDMIYLLPPDERIESKLSHEDRAKLELAGWHYDERDGWYHHV